MILLDTDVMVDIMRRYRPALVWLDSLGSDMIGIPGLVAMELLQGCRDRDEQRRVENLLRSYTFYWPGKTDCARAYDDFAAYYLGHSIGILDALIAETAVGLGVQLVTFNEKHYRVVSELQMLQPYPRR